jgi:HEAT repeat protein
MDQSRLARRVAVVCAVLAVIAIALTVFVGYRIVDAISRFQLQIEPGDVAQWVKEAMVLTLDQGAPEQKLEVIRVLADTGADAREYSASLVKTALADDDPRVREAAAAALKKVDPDAAAQFGID